MLLIPQMVLLGGYWPAHDYDYENETDEAYT